MGFAGRLCLSGVARLPLPMRTVEEKRGRKCSIDGPLGQGTEESGRSVARTSHT